MTHPNTIGRYRVDDAIRSSAAGRVYRVREAEGETQFDLTVRPSLAGLVDASGRPRSPVLGSASGFHDPRIERVARFDVDGTTPVTIAPHRRGETLAERIELAKAARRHTGFSDRPQTANETLAALIAIFETIARSLHRAHEAGYVHGHIAPWSILVTGDRAPLLLDLGLPPLPSTRVRELESAAMAYSAPERFRPGPVDARCDVYSLGACLYEAIARRRPFGGDSADGLLEAIRRGPTSFRRDNPAASPNLELVVRTALAADPKERYRSASAFADELGRVRRNVELAIKEPSIVTRAQAWRRRNPGGTRRVLGLGVALAAIVAASLWARAYTAADARTQIERSRDAARTDTALTHLALERDIERALSWRETIAAGDTDEERAWRRAADTILTHEAGVRQALERARASAGFRERTPSRDDRAAGRLADWRRDALAAAEVPGMDRWIERRDRAAMRVRRERLATREPVFGDDAAAWRHRRLAALLDDFARLRAAREDAPADLDARHEAAWSATIAAIARADRYAGLRLRPEADLWPLGRDPVSGLFEFAHLPTGQAPARGPDGRLAIDEGSGVVLVLIPGGSFQMGATKQDRDAAADEHPAHRVDLASFYFSKHEVTEAQFCRATGAVPANLGAAPSAPLRPVVAISWAEAARAAAGMRLALPTEAQWAFVRRAGAGPERTRDLAAVIRAREAWVGSGGGDSDAADAFAAAIAARPVGAGQPNALGVFDLLGNVAEWCRDPYGDYATEVATGSGARQSTSEQRVVRGGDFLHGAAAARATARRATNPETRSTAIGLRVARVATEVRP